MATPKKSHSSKIPSKNNSLALLENLRIPTKASLTSSLNQSPSASHKLGLERDANAINFDSTPQDKEKGHNEDTFYICHYKHCKKRFFDMSSLKKHSVTHEERHFVCKVDGCRKKFLDNSKLRRHMLVHSVNCI